MYTLRKGSERVHWFVILGETSKKSILEARAINHNYQDLNDPPPTTYCVLVQLFFFFLV